MKAVPIVSSCVRILQRGPWRIAVVAALGISCWSVCPADALGGERTTLIAACDSLTAPHDTNPDAQACLELLTWKAGEFDVQVDAATDGEYDALVSFPSPCPSGDPVNDCVTMEWYPAQADGVEDAEPRPAMVVIHESGSRMEAGRVFARAFSRKGLHAFLLHLPYYGERRKGGGRPENADFSVLVRQGISDVRRARDAVAVLPLVDASQIAVQGTSLGGFVATLVGSLDDGYDAVFIMLAGADFYDILQTGQKDTAKLRERFAQAGYEGERLKELLSAVECRRIAHRLDPQRTWMFSARGDEVVPIRNARLLGSIANLERSHQLEFPGGHYSVALYFPFIVDHVAQQFPIRRDESGKP
jgi:pimeloyl-ACP methyl ester carboxylesterase